MNTEGTNNEGPSEDGGPEKNSWLQAHSYTDLPPQLVNWIESNSNDVVSICNTDGEILFVSQSVEKVLGFVPAQIVGSEALDFLTPYDQQVVQMRLVKKDRMQQTFRLHIRDAKGEFIWMESEISLIEQPDSEEQLFISITKDISDKKEIEEMMVRSEKLSLAGQLAAGVAHEIRNPLTSLKGFLQLLQFGMEGKQDYYKIMEEELQKIETITSELLFISKPLTDDKKVEKISDMLYDVVVLLRSEAKLAGVEIQLDIIKDVEVICDRSQIKQVFLNLLKNAIESMGDGGSIEIAVNEDQQRKCCVVDVIDEGVGIPASILHKLTEPFFTTKKNGTGLGLMITNDIVERHGGKMKIYSNETKGSHFQVLLPMDLDTNL